MDYNLFAYDKDFDLMDDSVPESLAFSFLEPVRRARKVLEGRSSAQVEQLLASMNRYLAAGGELLNEEAMADTDAQGFVVYRVKALKCAAANITPEPLPGLSDVSWADYFAALSLAYLVEHLYEINSKDVEKLHAMERRLTRGTITAEIQQQRAQQRLASLVVEAFDAVAYAEQLQGESRLLDREGRRLAAEISRDRGKKGGQGRSSKFAELKALVIELVDTKYPHMNNRRAALAIWENELDDAQRGVLFGSEPEVTVAKWIGQHRRQAGKTA